MAIQCPIRLDIPRLRAEVSRTYTRLVERPYGDFHFHRIPFPIQWVEIHRHLSLFRFEENHPVTIQLVGPGEYRDLIPESVGEIDRVIRGAGKK